MAYRESALAKFAEGCWEPLESEWKGFHEFFEGFMEFSWKHWFLGLNKALGRDITEEKINLWKKWVINFNRWGGIEYV